MLSTDVIANLREHQETLGIHVVAVCKINHALHKYEKVQSTMRGLQKNSRNATTSQNSQSHPAVFAR